MPRSPVQDSPRGVVYGAAPLGVLVAAVVLAWAFPAPFSALKALIVPGLGVIMFGMGMTLRAEDVRRALATPRWLLLGVVLQFTVMPLGALAVGAALGLAPALVAGLVLTGACPGGTASNVMTWLARGNVALSVAMTTVSTLLAPFATPWLTWWLVGSRIEVPAAAMMRDVVLVVIVPVALGMAVRWRGPALGRRLEAVFPWLSIAVIALIVAVIVALNQARLAELAAVLTVAVMLHNGLGLALGYLGARALGAAPAERRTIAFEVGMQNSGLATVLALKYLPAAAALPAALFSVWHNVSALWLATQWRRRATERT